MLEITEQQKEELKKYPELKAMVDEYIATDGDGVKNKDGEIEFPPFLVWTRTHLEDDIGWHDMREFLEWDEDEDLWIDFTSWGHNSRWGRVFWPWVDNNFEDAVAIALALQYRLDEREPTE